MKKSLFRHGWPHFHAFGLLALNGEDLRGPPPLERKRRLLATMPIERRLRTWITSQSTAAICVAPCERDLEGIVGKSQHVCGIQTAASLEMIQSKGRGQVDF